VRFKHGNTRTLVRQGGGPVRRVEPTPEVCAAALDSRASTAARDEWRKWLRGKRAKPDSKDKPVFDRCAIERRVFPDLDEEREELSAAIAA
jgi:hypothetical protein